MSLVASLNVGVSSLRSFSQGIQVISNNIANVSTVGYKSSHANYSDTFNNLLRPLVPNEKGIGAKIDPTQIGGGVQVQSVTATFTQGTVTATGTTSDLAIAGPGYFRVKDPVTGNEYVTRAGNFRFDANGFLVTQQGYRVQGTAGATTNVSYDPSTTSFDVKRLASNPVETAGRITSSPAATGQTTIELNDTSGLSVGMVVYSAKQYKTTNGDSAARFQAAGNTTVTGTAGQQSIAVGGLPVDIVNKALYGDGALPAFPDNTLLASNRILTGPGIPNNCVVSGWDGAGTLTLRTPAALTGDLAQTNDSLSYYSIPAWKNPADPNSDQSLPLNFHAEIVSISGKTVTLSNAVSNTTRTDAPINLTFIQPQTTKLDASGMVQIGDANSRVFAISVNDTSGIANGMVATLVDPATGVKTYAGVTKDQGSNAATRLILDFSAFGDTTTNPNPTAGNFNSRSSFSVKFETHDDAKSYDPAGQVGDVRITFEENRDYELVDLNGGSLTVADLTVARTKVPKIKSFSVGVDGSILATLSNGQNFITGKVLLQDFMDPGALVREGDNLFSGMDLAGEKNTVKWKALSVDSLAEVTAGSSGLGVIQGSALEQSNVDIGQEFATMITTQRSFQAGSRVITVADQMLEETVNLKR
jgi:flagellar hook protein FlgE